MEPKSLTRGLDNKTYEIPEERLKWEYDHHCNLRSAMRRKVAFEIVSVD